MYPDPRGFPVWRDSRPVWGFAVYNPIRFVRRFFNKYLKKISPVRYGRTAGAAPEMEYLRGMDSAIRMRRPG